MNLSHEEFYNSHKILLILKEIGDLKIWKNEIFDFVLREKVIVYYLKFDGNNFPINKKQFEQLKEYGIKEKII